MNIVMEVKTWSGAHWVYDSYSVRLQAEDLIYTINGLDTMSIKGLGKLIVNGVELDDSCVTIHCTSYRIGGLDSGEDRFTEAPWA